MTTDDPSLANPAVQEQPYDYYRTLRETPVVFDERLGFFICSTYEVMREVLRNTEVFSNVDSQTMDSMRKPPDEVLEIRRQSHGTVNTLVTNDPPSHTRYRKMVDEPFRPRSIEKLKEQILDVVELTIDEFIARGACDAVQDLAIPIPVRVIADMLGLPRDLAPRIKVWSDASVEPLGMMVSDERLIECARLIKEFQDCMVEALEARRQSPTDDLLTHLVEARDEQGNAFTMAEMLSLTQQFLVAGNETTTNAIAAGVELLARNPTVQRELAENPDRALTFANEVLRLESPVAGLFRVVKKDTELAGVKLPAGSRIMLRFASANRDEAKYDQAEELDLYRANAGTHVAFGAGIHHCIGANLAREELRQTFATLTRRIADITIAGQSEALAHHPSMILRGLETLPITFTPKVAVT